MQHSPKSDKPAPTMSDRQIAAAAAELHANLKGQGYGSRQIVGLVAQVLGCVSSDLNKAAQGAKDTK